MVLGRAIDRIGPFSLELQKTPSTFGALCEAIVFQQSDPKAASTIFGRVRDSSQGPTGWTPNRS